MPWMVFYQQSAVVEKKLTLEELPAARLDTAVGRNAHADHHGRGAGCRRSHARARGGRRFNCRPCRRSPRRSRPFLLGETTGKLLFGLGLTGSALVATIVVTLTRPHATLSEVLGGQKHLA